MQKEISFYKEMASEHRLQENGRSLVDLFFLLTLGGLTHLKRLKRAQRSDKLYGWGHSIKF